MPLFSCRRSSIAYRSITRGRALALVALGTALATSVATPLRAQGFEIVGGANLALGDLGSGSGVGLGLAFRRSARLESVAWSYRTDFGFDRFGGSGIYDNYQYLAATANLVHHSNRRLYQYGGFGLYQAKTVMKATPGTFGGSITEAAFGFQGGVGLTLEQLSEKAFVEVGVVSVLTSGRNSSWFPIRFGFRL